MEATSLRLLLFLLCFSSHVISLNSLPVTRTRNLMKESLVHGVSESTHMAKTEEILGAERILGRRMEIELNDYPGSGANNRHTPSPKPWRGCLDC